MTSRLNVDGVEIEFPLCSKPERRTVERGDDLAPMMEAVA